MAKYRRIPMKLLFVDDRYQRELSQRRVRKMADEFDEAKVGVLEVSYRGNDKYAVFDGQHRLAVLDVVGVTDAPCLVHEGLTPRQEAELFVAIQNERKKPRAVESFIARVFAGDSKAIAIDTIFKKMGLRVTGSPSNMGNEVNTVAAVTAAERVFDAGNLEDTLDILVGVWEEERKVLDANMIEAMSLFLALYGPKITESKLLDTLAEETPVTLIRRATGKRLTTGGSLRDLLVEELRALISGGQGGVVLKRPPMFERAVAVRHLRSIRNVFAEEAKTSNGRTPRLTQHEITQKANLTSANAGAAIKVLLSVGQLRQSGQKKLPGLPQSPAYIAAPVAKNPVAT